MGEINDAMCNYLGMEDVFADFWNGTIFSGREEIKSVNLQKWDKEYYKLTNSNKKSHHQWKTSSIRRDLLMIYREKQEIILGLEILDTIDYTIPIRIMDYDVQEMKRQLYKHVRRNKQRAKLQERYWKHSGEYLYGVRKRDKISPIYTIALYCGIQEFDGVHKLQDMIIKGELTEKFKSLKIDYPIHIFSLKNLEEENYQTGLRELIAIFKRSKDYNAMKKYYIEHKERFQNLDDLTIETMGILIGRKTLKLFKQEGGGLDLCKAFEDLKEETIFITMCGLVKDGLLELHEAAKRTNMTEEAFLRRMKESA